MVQNLVGGLHDMHEHPGRAVDAAVQLHEHLEQLSSQLSELESLRARVLEAERRALITEERVAVHGFSHREAGAAG
ncbi:hypothetical protein UNPA324_15930 [Bradyrhizobium sp. UNPA324]|nr:hypothetical protein UNPA324_15930 [Bradyrhizobium sp. UNPA324]